VVRSKAELLADTDGDPSTLDVSCFEVIRERVGSIVKCPKPDLESVAKAVALVLESDVGLVSVSRVDRT
jgi:hypothetical protein